LVAACSNMVWHSRRVPERCTWQRDGQRYSVRVRGAPYPVSTRCQHCGSLLHFLTLAIVARRLVVDIPHTLLPARRLATDYTVCPTFVDGSACEIDTKATRAAMNSVIKTMWPRPFLGNSRTVAPPLPVRQSCSCGGEWWTEDRPAGFLEEEVASPVLRRTCQPTVFCLTGAYKVKVMQRLCSHSDGGQAGCVLKWTGREINIHRQTFEVAIHHEVAHFCWSIVARCAGVDTVHNILSQVYSGQGGGIEMIGVKTFRESIWACLSRQDQPFRDDPCPTCERRWVRKPEGGWVMAVDCTRLGCDGVTMPVPLHADQIRPVNQVELCSPEVVHWDLLSTAAPFPAGVARPWLETANSVTISELGKHVVLTMLSFPRHAHGLAPASRLPPPLG